MFDRDLFGEPAIEQHKARLSREFEYPPFSVLSARDGWWQERKRQWLALGIKSEVGRGQKELGRSDQARDIGHYQKQRLAPGGAGTGAWIGGPARPMGREPALKEGRTEVLGGLTFGTMPNYGGAERKGSVGPALAYQAQDSLNAPAFSTPS
jgi:hypothetical protein